MDDITYYLILLGLIALAFISVYIWRSKAHYIPNPEEIQGEVVDLEVIEISSINPIKMLMGKREMLTKYHPVVRFKLGKEKRVRFRNRRGYDDRDEYQVGQEVTVVYCQDNPLIAKIKE